MTDCEFLLEVLADGQWRSLNEILRRSFDKRGHGLTTHSRAADLRKRGHIVEHRTVGKRGAGSEYRLVSERGDLAVSPPSRPGLTARDGVSPLADQLRRGAGSDYRLVGSLGEQDTGAGCHLREPLGEPLADESSPIRKDGDVSCSPSEQLSLSPSPRRGAYTESAS